MIDFKTYENFCESFNAEYDNKNFAEILFLLRNNFSAIRNLDLQDHGYISFDDLIFTRADFEPENYLEAAVKKMCKVFDNIAENMRNKIICNRPPKYFRINFF